MTITIRVPTEKEISKRSVTLQVARAGAAWSNDFLEGLARESGVYVHTLRDKVVYVGKTTRGAYGNFGERLRRECHEKPAQNSFLFKQLIKAKGARVSCFPISAIRRWVNLDRSDEHLALLFERTLISVYQPEWNRDVRPRRQA